MARSPFFRRRALVAVVGAALAAVLALPAVAAASPGQVDPAFGHLGNGTVWSDHGRGDFIAKVLHQPDGKIVTVATAFDTSGTGRVVVTRYLANGSLDASFATGGVFARPADDGSRVTDALLQPDGKIVVAGWAQSFVGPTRAVREDFFVTRLRSNGTLDPSFATAHPTTSFGAGTLAEAFAVALGPAGTIVLAGRVDEEVALARYTATGALDPSFSGDGRLVHDFGSDAQATDVAVLGDGRIVVAGVTATLGDTRALLARFNANGTLDPTYGSGGRVPAAGAPLVSVAKLLQQGGKAVVVGNAATRDGTALARYNANGTLDTSFGSGGKSRLPTAVPAAVTDITADASGRLVAVGDAAFADHLPTVPIFTALFRFSANGGLDPSFGCFGSVLTEVLGNGGGATYYQSTATSVAAAGNDIVVGGQAASLQGNIAATDAFVGRYDGAGAPSSGYGLLRADSGTSAFGGAPACGSTAGFRLNAPMVGIAYDDAAPGNWTVASDGGVFTFGAARFLGSMGGTHLNQPIVGMASTPDGAGYWLVARDGGIFAFGTAKFFGSMGGVRLNKPVVGMSAAKDGKGYWLVASDGGVFSFGSAKFAGSTGSMRLNKPVVGIAADPDAKGYWIVASDGGVFSFDAKFAGSTGNIALAQPVVGIAADPDGAGYWMAARDGGLFAFDAKFDGSTGATPFPAGSSKSTIAIAATPPRRGPI